MYKTFLKEYEDENPEIEELRQFRKLNYQGERPIVQQQRKEDDPANQENKPATDIMEQSGTFEKASNSQKNASKKTTVELKKRASLRKKGSIASRKNLKLSVKSEFLNINSPPVVGIAKEFILRKLLELPLNS